MMFVMLASWEALCTYVPALSDCLPSRYSPPIRPFPLFFLCLDKCAVTCFTCLHSTASSYSLTL